MVETIRVTSEAMAAETIASAYAQGRSVEIAGRGSKWPFGRPIHTDMRLETTGLAGITLYEPAELVMRAGAGTPLEEIEAALAANGQMLAFEPRDLGGLLGTTEGTQSIGGVVATNLAGPRRCVAGAVRDHVLGLRAVNGRGEVFKTGGRVVKNVTGYDLCKLLTGSFGTLAVFTEVTFKVLPAPETEETVVLHGVDAETAVRLMGRALGSAADISGAAWMPAALAEGGDRAFLRLEGFGPSVKARRRYLMETIVGGTVEATVVEAEESHSLWRNIRDVRVFHGRWGQVVWKLAVRPSDAPALLQRLGEQTDGEAFIDGGGAFLWLSLPCPGDAPAGLIRGLLPDGGHATLVAGPEAERAAQAVFQPLPAPLAALEARVKASFDPKSILNPGRMA